MRRASDPSAINSRSPAESSHIMIVQTLIVIAHSPMVIRNAFSGVAWFRSTVRGEPGLNINIFMSIAEPLRRRRGRNPALGRGLFSSVFPIDLFNGLMLMVVRA